MPQISEASTLLVTLLLLVELQLFLYTSLIVHVSFRQRGTAVRANILDDGDMVCFICRHLMPVITINLEEGE